MSVSVTSSLFPPTNIPRRSADYHPDIWGDHFIQYLSESSGVSENVDPHITSLKEKVRGKLIQMKEETLIQPGTVANLIDSIQRLGLSYHFQHEIDEILQHIYNNYVANSVLKLNEEDLHSHALIFRLLRQQGYYISPDVFNKFKDEEGNFNKRLMADVEGMLSLYEAAHLRIHGEDILDEADTFTSLHLETIMATQLSPSIAAKVKNSLKRPIRKNIPRLVARHYISTYEEEHSHDETLLLLAKLDFNMLQRQHQKEVGTISKWWKELNFAEKCPFARNRIVELYFWMMGVYFEPQYSFGRRIITKVISLISIMDDTYDVYATIDELEILTEAIERWDITCIDILPEYMKDWYIALLNTYEEIEDEMTKEGKTICVIYAKTEMKRLAQAYFAEAKWFNKNYTPTTEEYLSVALVSSGYRALSATSFLGMGCFATEKAFRWLTKDPKISVASAIIARLMNDIVSSEREQKKGDVASALDCYMKQHGVTKEHAINEFSRQVANAWKDINEACLDPIDVPKPLIMRILNLTRTADVIYKDKDAYTDSNGSTKKNIEALLVNPCPI